MELVHAGPLLWRRPREQATSNKEVKRARAKGKGAHSEGSHPLLTKSAAVMPATAPSGVAG